MLITLGIKVKKPNAGQDGKVLYYSLVLQHPISGQTPIAVTELISSEHDIGSIAFFLSKFFRDVHQVCPNINFLWTLEIDNSMALILAVLTAMNCDDMHSYLQRSHRILIGEMVLRHFDKCNPHVCSAHVLNAIKKKALKLYVFVNLFEKCFQRKYLN